MTSSIKAVFFDLDGVLVHSPLNLAAIKRELFGDSETYIIEGLENLPVNEREEKNAILLKREMEAAADSELDPSVPELFHWLDTHGIKRGVITRNAREVVDFLADKHDVDFGVIVAREDAPPKPDPRSVLLACDKLGIDPIEAVMVGDFRFDIEAGNSAGCRTVFVESEKYRDLNPGEDVRIDSLSELIDLLEEWIGVRSGK